MINHKVLLLPPIKSIKVDLTKNSLKTIQIFYYYSGINPVEFRGHITSSLVLGFAYYGNMFLVNFFKVAAQSIQFIINTTARLITSVVKFYHITSVLKKLYLLRI